MSGCLKDDPPKIDFPCDYPIKVIVVVDPQRSAEQLDEVLSVVHAHAEPINPDTLQQQPSREGKYVSVRMDIVATGEGQLRALHSALRALPYVKLVL